MFRALFKLKIQESQLMGKRINVERWVVTDHFASHPSSALQSAKKRSAAQNWENQFCVAKPEGNSLSS